MRVLPNAIQSLPKTVRWLSRFSEWADYIGVNYNQQEVIATLESKYQDGAHVGRPKEDFQADPQVMGEYIVGQAINCLKSGMPPHPVTQRFAKEYQQIAEWQAIHKPEEEDIPFVEVIEEEDE